MSALAAVPDHTDGDREYLALEAAYEMEHIAKHLLALVPSMHPDTEGKWLVRTLAMRVRQLATVQMNALGDDMVTYDQLVEDLRGARPAEVRHD